MFTASTAFDHLARGRPPAAGWRSGNHLGVRRAGVVRGVHFADVPPGQRKYVMCTRGRRARSRRGTSASDPRTFGPAGRASSSKSRPAGGVRVRRPRARIGALTDEDHLTYLRLGDVKPDRRSTGIPPAGDPDLGIAGLPAEPTLRPADHGRRRPSPKCSMPGGWPTTAQRPRAIRFSGKSPSPRSNPVCGGNV